MARGQSGALCHIGTLFATGSVVGVPDLQLLERFILQRDEGGEAAFAALVARHGPMVFRLCCDILRDRHDAEDAFQATFLLLATKARRIRNGELLGNWLHGVAVRTAMKARSSTAIPEVKMSLILGKLKTVSTSVLVCVLLTAGIVSVAQPQKTTAPVRSAEQEVLDLEHAWGQALVNCDAATMDRIVAYEMVGTDPTGHLWNKTAYLESVKAGAFKVESFEVVEVKVHVYGDAAVAIGLGVINKHSKSGFGRGAVRSTDTYVRRNGCWQCVAWHAMGVADLPETRTAQLPDLSKTAESTNRALPSDSELLVPIPFEQFKSAEPKAAKGATDLPKRVPDSPGLKRAEPKVALRPGK